MAKAAYIGIEEQVPIYGDNESVSITASNIADYFNIANGSYYFAGSGSVFTSNNKGVNSSTASTILTAKQDIQSISFDYSWSSESNYDKFTLKVGGTTIQNAVSGATTNKSYSGSLAKGQTIEFVYAKDSSQHSNDDQCTFSNMVLNVASIIGYDKKSIAHKVKKGFVGINGVARKIKKAYIGVNNVAKLIYQKLWEPNWVELDDSITKNHHSVIYGNGIFVAVGYTNYLEYSADGINWDSNTNLPYRSDPHWTSVCYGDGKFVAVAYGDTIAAYSEDGITWTQATMPASANWTSVCYGNGKFVAVAGSTNTAAYSEDGITWTQATMPASANWKSVCYGADKFVAVAGSTNTAAYSEDGITWTQATMPASANWTSVCYGNGKFVAVVYLNINIAAYSEDGINWTQSTIPGSNYWYSLCYGDGKFVVVAAANHDATAYSTDGITWTQATMPTSANWYSLCYGDGKFVSITDSYSVAYTESD